MTGYLSPRGTLPASVAEQCRHQIQLARARIAPFAWINWLFALGFSLSALGLVTSLARFEEEGSPTFRLIFLAFFVVFFGACVVLWLMPLRPKPRIVPYFARRSEEYGGRTSIAFARGRGLYLEIAALDQLAATLGVSSLSAFGFSDDYYAQEVHWYPASEGLRTVEALRQGLGTLQLTTPDVANDLEALASALRAAADHGVDFSLVLRLHKQDSLQVVMTRESRQGSFW